MNLDYNKKNQSHLKKGLYNKGFTLLEVMVSLLIVALALTSLVKGAAGKVNNANELRDKTFAQWVAVNKITEWRALHTLPTSNSAAGEQMMGQQQWFWAAKFIKTDIGSIRKAEISVYKDEEKKDKKEQPIIRFITFISSR